MKYNRKEFVKDILLLFLLCIVIFNFLSGFYGFLQKENLIDDFTLRYRESKYILNGVDPFNIILGKQKAIPKIGELADVAGYTPWGMVYGIVFNLVILPLKCARWIFCMLYIGVMILTAYIIYRETIKRNFEKKDSIIVTLGMLSIYGWSTGLNWLNVGAILGVLVFYGILIMDKFPILSGIFLGIAAAKPQIALPFFLGYLVLKKYKIFVTATIIPTFAWIISFVLTKTSPFEMLLEFKEVINVIGNQLGNWITGFGVLYNVNFNDSRIQFIGIILCILIALYSWNIMNREKVNGENDKLCFFSVAAVLSVMWTYSQEHDKTVLIIVIMAIVGMWKALNSEKEKKFLLLVMLCCIIDATKVTNMFKCLLAVGTLPELVIEFVRNLVLISFVLFLTNGKNIQEKKDAV